MENRNPNPQDDPTRRTAAPRQPDGASEAAVAEDPDERQRRALGLGKSKPRPSAETSAEPAAAPAPAPNEAELAQAKEELASLQDKLVRQAAEFQNFRRRTAQEKSTLVEYGKSLVLQNMLDAIDDVGRSKEAAEKLEGQEDAEAAYRALKKGVDLVYEKFMSELARLDVQPIEAVGRPFDEKEHEAIMQQPAPEGMGTDVVLQEVQKGYRMGDRVLRHSKVIVSA